MVYSFFHTASEAVDAQQVQAQQMIALAHAAQGFTTGDKAAQTQFNRIAARLDAR